MIRISLPTADQIKDLDIFKSESVKRIATNYATFSGAKTTELNKEKACVFISSEDNFLTSTYNGDYTYYVDSQGELKTCESDSRNVSLRPIIYFDDLSEVCKDGLEKTDKDGFGIIEYGYYLRSIAPHDIQVTLDSLLSSNKLKLTSRKFTRYKTKITDEYGVFYPQEILSVYEYEGNYYAYVSACLKSWRDSYYKYRFVDRDFVYNDGDYAWIKVEPIKFIVDTKNKLMIPQESLMANVPVEKNKFRKNYAQKYLENVFLREMNQSFPLLEKKNVVDNSSVKEDEVELDETSIINEPVNNNENERSIIINGLLSEIRKELKYYFGEEDYNKKAIQLINDYNEKVKNLFKKDKIELTFDSKQNNKMLFINLQISLETILAELREKTIRNKPYVYMLDIIKECLILIDSKDKKEKYINSISESIVTIRDVIVPYIGSDTLLNSTKSVLMEFENKIYDFLNGNDNAFEKVFTSPEEIEMYFRKYKLEPLLKEIKETVDSKPIVDEIRKSFLEVCLGNFKKSKDEYINHQMKNIIAMIQKVKKYGTPEEIARLNKVLDEKKEFQDTANKAFESLVSEIIIPINKIILDIEERENAIVTIDNESEIKLS